MSITHLRTSLRQRRQALTRDERAQKSLAITSNLISLPQFIHAESVAFYAALPEEVDTGEAVRRAQEAGKTCYLPVINRVSPRSAPLLFHHFSPGVTTMIKGEFGIREPAHRPGSGMPGPDLDLVCVPLVGFNEACDRIGMGKAYYDRCFSGRGGATENDDGRDQRQVFLVGLAFSCQQAEFEPQAHDVRMDAIVTEARVFLPNQRPST